MTAAVETISGLTAERDALVADVTRLRAALLELAALNAWQNFGGCRAFTDFGHNGVVMAPDSADDMARTALTPSDR